MFEKEYYRLEDLRNRYNMTEADVHYLVAEKGLTPCFYLPSTAFIIGDWQANGFVGFANVQYEGIVAIPQKHIQELVNKRKVLPLHYDLFNNTKIRLVDTEYGCNLPIPNEYIQGWQSKDLSQISWPKIPAKLYPYVAPTLKNTFKDLLMSFAKNEADKAASVERFDSAFGEAPTHELRPFYKTFSFSDICIRHEDLVALRIIGDQSSTELISTQITPELDGNQFEKLLAKIILSDKTLSAKPVFKILVNECKQQEDLRRFDTEGILLEHVEGIIIWRDVLSKTQEKKCSLSTLGNKLTRVRGTLAKQG